MSHIQIKTPSFPRKRESSKIKNFSEADKKQCSDPLREAYSINWIPAFAGMTW
jgi:hypothetical protein